MGNVERILVVVIMATIVVILALAIWGLGQDEVNTSPYGTASGVAPDKEVPLVDDGSGGGAAPPGDDDAIWGEISVVEPPETVSAPPSPIARVDDAPKTVPGDAGAGAPPPSSARPPTGSIPLDSPIAGMRRYRVEKGDTYSTIAFKVLGDRNLWKQIADANKDVRPERLAVGMEILVPARPEATVTKAPVPEPAPPLLAASAATSDKAKKDARVYVTRKGDTLYGIAKRELNDPSKWKSIYEMNRRVLPSEKVVPVGLALELPEAAR